MHNNNNRPGYKETKLGWIPEEWKAKPLVQVAFVQTGIAKGAKPPSDPVECPYLRVANVQDGYLDLSDVQRIPVQKDNIERYRLRRNDLLLIEGNGNPANLGRCAIWSGQVNDCVHQNHIFVVRTKETQIDFRFLALQVHSARGRYYFISCSKSSSGLATLNSTQLKAFPILLPPLPEQRAIAAVLSVWDQAIEKTERLIQAKEKRFKGLLQSLINPTDKTGWRKVKLGNLFGNTLVVEKGRAIIKGDTQSGRIPVVAGGQTYAYYHNEATHHHACITISASGAYAGFVWFHDYPIWASDCNVIYATEGSTCFFYYALKSLQHQIFALQAGGAQPHVYAKDLKNLIISVPGPDEQKRIAETLNLAQQEIDLLKKLAEKQKLQKRGLMQKLLTGEWRVKGGNTHEL